MKPVKRTGSVVLSLSLSAAILALVPACGDLTPRAGIGEVCVSSDDCQASSCNDGICTKNCSTNIDCPSPTQCFKSLCQYPLRVGAMYSGSSSENEGWTYTCNNSLVEATNNLGYAQLSVENQIYGGNDPPLIGPAVKRLVEDQKVDVIVATDSSEGKELEAARAQYPQTKFIAYKEPGSSFFPAEAPGAMATYASNSVPGWYLAGKLAVQLTHAKRLGIIGAALVPSAVQAINAYTRGAQSEDPTVVVEVRWVGFWIDINSTGIYPYKGKTYFREDLITQQLVDGGAVVVASIGDSGRPIRLIEKNYPKAYSVAANYQYSWRDLQKSMPFATCLGSVYSNFRPYLEQQIAAIHTRTWKPTDTLGVIDADLPNSMIGFEPNPSSGIDDANAKKVALSLAGQKGLDTAFKGPYQTTGQLDLDDDGKPDAVQSVAAGVVLSASQLGSMCWFVKGVVEKKDRDDSSDAASVASPMSADVDAHVPDDRFPPAKGVIIDFGANCKTGH
jgi:basic membrane lipoprotein Med (substrate-binding protein (PBP1-ABC) superfamily)